MQGQEFVYLASQNTQAALIDGNTLHSFAELQVKAPKQGRQTQFGPDKFVKRQRLWWLIVDERSTVALEVLAVLPKRLAEATRKKRSWKCRDTTHERPFGGVNFLCAGDFWQFPSVRATSLFQNPFSKGVSVQVANLHRLFWTHGEDGVQRCVAVAEPRALASPVWAAVPRGVVLPTRLSHATRRQLVPEQRPVRLPAGAVQRTGRSVAAGDPIRHSTLVGRPREGGV